MRTASTIKALFTTCLLIIPILSCANSIHAQTSSPGPTLLIEQDSPRAAALDSVYLRRDPLPVVSHNLFNNDRRTRLTLFGTNVELMPGENASAITARARDSRSKNHSLTVEFVGKVPGIDSLTQIIVKLPDGLAQAGDVWISMDLRGQTSNEVPFKVEVQTEPRQVTLLARRVTNGQDNYVNACFSFEFGMNGEGSLPLTLNDWDILFGNDPNRDTFDVTTAGSDRSRIQDLGALNWGDVFQIPTLDPLPTDEPEVNVVVGHMYVVHTIDSNSDLYALFRVEALEPGKSVTISWKSVRSP